MANQITVDLALQILFEASTDTSETPQDTVPVRLALRVLLPLSKHRGGLTEFWEGASHTRGGLRSAALNRALNIIVRDLIEIGAWVRPEGFVRY